jgi:RNA polymerase sigma-70 factor (ECF subfamily)
MSTAADNTALQRARATLASRNISLDAVAEEDVNAAGLSDEEATLLDRYLDAFERYDIDSLVLLLREDATLSMPPYTLWLQGRDHIRSWLLGRGLECRGSRMVATSANGRPAFAQYRRSPGGGYHAFALTILELAGGRITAWNAFLDVDTLFPYFGLPLTLPAEQPAASASGGQRSEAVAANR